MEFDIKKEKKVAIKAANEAGKFLLKSFDKVKEIHFKKSGKYKEYPQEVSNIDIEADKLIISMLKKHFLEYNFLTEDLKTPKTKNNFTWIIDPIDGTTHYLRGLPYFSVSIALQFKNDIVLGVVMIPAFKEIFVAQKNDNAYLNGKKIKVSNNDNLEKIIVGSSAFYSYKIAKSEEKLLKLLNSVEHVRIFGTPAIDLCNVAAGRLDGRITSSTNPWDVSAACLIIEEAGGKVTDWNGKTWNPYSKNLVASNGVIHEKLLEIVR